MMRRTIYSCFLIGSLAISCNPPDRNHHQLGLEYNRDNLLDVTHTATGSILIRSLNASYADQDGRIRYFLDGKERRTTRSFSDEMGSGTEIVFENDYEDDSLQIKWILRTFEDKPALVGRLEMKNNSSDKKRINRLVPFSTGEIHSDQGQNQDQGGILMDTDDTLRYLEIQPETWAYKYQRKLNSSGTGKFVTGIATPKGNGVVIGCISFDRFRGTFVFKDRRKNSGLLNFL
jgi:hypothetical protein